MTEAKHLCSALRNHFIASRHEIYLEQGVQRTTQDEQFFLGPMFTHDEENDLFCPSLLNEYL